MKQSLCGPTESALGSFTWSASRIMLTGKTPCSWAKPGPFAWMMLFSSVSETGRATWTHEGLWYHGYQILVPQLRLSAHWTMALGCWAALKHCAPMKALIEKSSIAFAKEGIYGIPQCHPSLWYSNLLSGFNYGRWKLLGSPMEIFKSFHAGLAVFSDQSSC